MLRVLLHLAKDPLFDREDSGVVYSIRELSSARAGFVVPDRCEAWIDLHLPPEVAPAEVEAAIRVRAASAGQFVADLDLEVSFDFSAGGYALESENPLGAILEKTYPQLGIPLRYDAFRSHSDGNLFHKSGVNALILGPGNLETAHTPEEQAPFLEVLAAARIYLALCLGMK
jgi:acetylornithine deacetylase